MHLESLKKTDEKFLKKLGQHNFLLWLFLFDVKVTPLTYY